MAAFALSNALAFVTSAVVAPAAKIVRSTAARHRSASIKRAKMSAPSLAHPSGVTSPGSFTQQNIILDIAGPILIILTPPAEPADSTASTCSNLMFPDLMAPQFDSTESPIKSPSTPVLKAQSGENLAPTLNLDSVHKETSLITTSPYAQNEGLTFSKDTSLWQPQAGVKSALQTSSQGSPAIISKSCFDRNEGLKFAPCTLLWQPTNPIATTKQQASAPSLWTPANACEWKSNGSAPLSMRPMTAPLPVTNLITQSPFCTNESIQIPAGTSMWQPGSAAAFKTQGSTSKPSLVTSSPYDFNENVSFPKGTLLWQPKAKVTDNSRITTRFSRSCTLSFPSGLSCCSQQIEECGKCIMEYACYDCSIIGSRSFTVFDELRA